MTTNKRYPWDEVGESVKEQYLNGKSTLELEEVFGIPQGSIYAFLQRSGVPMRTASEAGAARRYTDRACLICSEQYTPTSAPQKYCCICIPDHKAMSRYRTLGISQRDWNKMFEAQKGICALCPSPATAADHDHKTGVIRGLLCGFCNTALNRVEIQGWANRAVEYLKRETGFIANVDLTVRQCWLVWKLIDSLRNRGIPFEGPNEEFSAEFEKIRTKCLERAYDYNPQKES